MCMHTYAHTLTHKQSVTFLTHDSLMNICSSCVLEGILLATLKLSKPLCADWMLMFNCKGILEDTS